MINQGRVCKLNAAQFSLQTRLREADMDWTKAKSILIVALIFTNIVLLCVIISNRTVGDRTNQLTGEIINILRQKNVVLETELPLKKEKLPVLYVRYSGYDQEMIRQKIAAQTEQADTDTPDAAIDIADAFLADCGFMDENVKLKDCKKESGAYVVTYKDVIEDRDIEPDYVMVCRVQNGKIAAFERNWLTPIEFGTSTKEVIPVTTALMKFVSLKKDEEKTVVNDISMVYWLERESVNVSPEQTQSDTARPAWRIRYNNGKEMFIIAYEIN